MIPVIEAALGSLLLVGAAVALAVIVRYDRPVCRELESETALSRLPAEVHRYGRFRARTDLN